MRLTKVFTIVILFFPLISFSQEKELNSQRLSDRSIDSIAVNSGGNIYLMKKNIIEKQKTHFKSIKNKIDKELISFKLKNSTVLVVDNPNGTATFTVVHAYGKVYMI